MVMCVYEDIIKPHVSLFPHNNVLIWPSLKIGEKKYLCTQFLFGFPSIQHDYPFDIFNYIGENVKQNEL